MIPQLEIEIVLDMILFSLGWMASQTWWRISCWLLWWRLAKKVSYWCNIWSRKLFFSVWKTTEISLFNCQMSPNSRFYCWSRFLWQNSCIYGMKNLKNFFLFIEDFFTPNLPILVWKFKDTKFIVVLNLRFCYSIKDIFKKIKMFIPFYF